LVSAIEKRFNRGLWPWVFLVTGAFVVSTNHVLGRYIGGEIPPIGLAFWRVTVGALVLLPFAWRDILEQRFVILKEWKLFFLMAILFMPMGNAMVYLGYNFSTALNGGIIATSQPATTVFLAWLILNHNINRKQILGVIIAAFGVLIILSEGDLFALSSLTFNKGDLMLIVATTSFSFYTILLRKIPSSIGPMLILVVIQIIGIIVLAPFYLYEWITYMPVPTNFFSVLVIAWVGIVVAVIAVGLTNMSVLSLGPAKSSIGHYCRAIFTAGLAIVLLNEEMEIYHWLSIGLVIIGVVLMSRGQTPTRRTEIS
tara:strand:- start:12796 stop:13731 length:936 start_codon:yes stop_codon:yes gene_type:complete